MFFKLRDKIKGYIMSIFNLYIYIKFVVVISIAWVFISEVNSVADYKHAVKQSKIKFKEDSLYNKDLNAASFVYITLLVDISFILAVLLARK